jgi:hypothetical protein
MNRSLLLADTLEIAATGQPDLAGTRLARHFGGGIYLIT